jgi:drug/metabolite transporter (DMT)-like permease
MLDLLLSIASSTALILILKSFSRYEIDTFQGIVFNYWACVLTGWLMLGYMPLNAESPSQGWFSASFTLGALFVTGFYCTGITLQKFGLMVASMMQKMSLVLSVPFAVLVFGEPFGWLKISGLVLALGAIFLTSLPSPETNEQRASAPSNKLLLLFPAYVFFNCGIGESILQYTQVYNLTPTATADQAAQNAGFTMACFGWAGALGTVALIAGILIGKIHFKPKNVLAGIILGIPNYFSIYFLLRALDYSDKSIILPTNNIGVIIVATLFGCLVFRERINQMNLIGILLAISSILLLAIA